MKSNKSLIHATKWMKFKSIMLSVWAKNLYCRIPLCNSLEKTTLEGHKWHQWFLGAVFGKKIGLGNCFEVMEMFCVLTGGYTTVYNCMLVKTHRTVCTSQKGEFYSKLYLNRLTFKKLKTNVLQYNVLHILPFVAGSNGLSTQSVNNQSKCLVSGPFCSYSM